jgi:hypothetical protein
MMHFIRKDKDENLTTADISKSGQVEKKEGVLKPDERAEERTAEMRGGPQLVSGEPKPAGEVQNAPLFPEGEMRDLHARWDKIQAAFVDEPKQAVQDADNLVAVAIKRLAEQFAEERSRVEKEWTGGEISTESLRQSLRKYRAFFERVLSV